MPSFFQTHGICRMFVAVIYWVICVFAGIAIDGGNGICNGTCEEVPIALVKRQGRVAVLVEEVEGCIYSDTCS